MSYLDTLRQFVSGAENKVSNFFNGSPVQSPIPQSQPVRQGGFGDFLRSSIQAPLNYFNPTSNGGNNFWSSPVNKALVNTQQSLHIPQVDLGQFMNNDQSFSSLAPQLPHNITNAPVIGGIINGLYGAGTNVAGNVFDLARDQAMQKTGVKLPYNQLKSPVSRLLANVNGQNVTPQQVIGNVAGIAEPIVNMYAPETGVGILKEGAGKSGIQALKTIVKDGAWQGLKLGALQGGVNNLAANRDSTLPNQLLQGGVGTVEGGLLGGALGGLLAGAGGIYKMKPTQALKSMSEFWAKNTPDPTAEGPIAKAYINYLRDPQGRFREQGSKTPAQIMTYDEFRTSKGMPNPTKPQYGYTESRMDIPNLSSSSSKSDGQLSIPGQQAKGRSYKQQLLNTDYKKSNSTGMSDISNPSTQDYIKQMSDVQRQSGNVDKGSLLQKGNTFLADIKRKLVDSTAPIEDIIAQAKRKGDVTITPKNDISNQIDRSLRSRELAGQFLKDNGLVDTIRQVPDINTLNQYLIAKHAPEVQVAGFKTGRNTAADEQLVKNLGSTYEPFAQKVVQYGQSLLDKAVETGLVSKETASMLKEKYPNYVPLNRVFNELEKSTVPEGVGKGVASLSKQTVVKGLQGSERAIHNPIESLLSKTADVFSQGERNQAGKILASYKDIPGNPFQLRELGKGESATHTISYLDNGVKKTFETTPEIATAAKFLDKRQLGFIGNLFATPVRLARVGITGINLPFTATNVVKDQVSAFINSDRPLQTSVANPAVFLKSLWTAAGHGAEYDNWIRNAGGGTSFDISRSAPQESVARIRAGRNIGTQIAYTATHPSELLRAAENLIARSEETTRLQQFIGTRDALLKEGKSPEEANIAAAKASRENTVNFARSGDWGKALNSVFLYMNSGIQGSRTLMRNLKNHPIATSTKIGLGVFAPIAAVTTWNMSDPKRLQAYNDIRDFEKENNLIIIPPNPTKDPVTGKWNVIKVPFSQEIANLTIPVRKGIEALHGADPPGFGDVASALIGSATSLNTQSTNALVGQFIPQAVKPPLEMTLNKNLFTGADIVPQYLPSGASKDLPPNMQVYPNTSGTAREIGGALNTSPLKVEQFIKDTAGGVGSQLLNASDQIQAKAGIIPKDQIGGQSIGEGLTARFAQATGGQQLSNFFDNATKGKGNTGGATNSMGVPMTENKGKWYVDLGNGKVKSFNSQQKANNLIVTNDGKTIDLSPPTKGQGIDSFTNQNWNVTKARDVYKADLTDQQKQAAYKQLGVDPSTVEYDYKATHSTDIKTQYILSKATTMPHTDLINQLQQGRVVSSSGVQFASDTVLINLYNQGVISKPEEQALKKIKIDKNGKNIAAPNAGTKPKKISLSGLKVTLPKITLSKTTSSSFKAPKVKAPPIGKLTYKKQPKKLKLK